MSFYGFLFSLLFTFSFSKLFVDCENGNDSNDGSEAFPIKSIEKLNSLILSKETEKVFLKNGCTFTDSLEIFAAKDIEITNFQDGNEGLPKLDLSQKPENSWENEGESIYSTTVENNVLYVFQDNKVMDQSHFPQNALKNFSYISETQSNTLEIDVEQSFFDQLQGRVLVGAKISIKAERWIYHRTEITGINEAERKILIDNGGPYSPYEKDFGFFCTGKKWMLEYCWNCWYYDKIEKKLYVKISEEKEINKVSITYLSSDTDTITVNIQSSSNIAINNLIINNAVNYGIKIDSNSENIELNDIKIVYSGEYGFFSEAKNLKTERINVLEAGRHGMRFFGTFDVSNCQIQNIFTNPLNVEFSGTRGTGNGIQGACDGIDVECLIDNNKIFNVGYAGIVVGSTLSTGNGQNIVSNNLIDTFCVSLDDCSGIYWYKTGGHIIKNNLIMNGLGDAHGTPSFFSGEEVKYTPANGIYADDQSFGSTITENTIIDVSNYGIFLHNSANNTVTDNLIFNAGRMSFYVSEDSNSYPGFVVGNIIKSNSFHSYYDPVFSVVGRLGVNISFNQLDFNLYSYENFLFNSESYYSLEQWRENTIQDFSLHGSRIGGNNFNSVTQYEFPISANLMIDGNFSQGIDGWSRYPASICSLSWNQSNVNSLKILVEPQSSVTYYLLALSRIFENDVIEGERYTFEYEIQASIDDVDVSATLSGLANLGYLKYHNLKEKKRWYQINDSFIAKENKTGARLGLGCKEQRGPFHFYIRNIKFFKSKIIYHDKTKDFTLFVNTESSEKIVKLDQNYCNINGNIVEGEIRIAPLKAELLVNCFCNYDDHCNNYENANSCPSECQPKCGNGVCEANENWRNCPEDCLNFALLLFGISLPTIFLLGLILVFFILIAIILFIFIKRKKKNKRNKRIMEMEAISETFQ